MIGKIYITPDRKWEEMMADREKYVQLRDACAKDNEDICQALGRVLGYPRFADDQLNFPGATDADGVCVGDHVAASLAMEAADEIDHLRKIIDIITGPPLTPEEAEAELDGLPELDEADREAMAGIDINKIIAYATDPSNMSPEEAVRRMVVVARETPGFDERTLHEVDVWLKKRWP